MILFLMLQATSPATTPTPAPAPPPWTPVSRTDATTGATSMTAAVSTVDKAARLSVRCDRTGDPVVSIQFRTRQPMAKAEDHVVRLSFDGAAPMETKWEFPGSATFVREVNAVTVLTQAMASARDIKLETLDAAGSISATFDGPGSDASIREVLSTCGYTLGVVPEPTKKPTKK